ncbi:MAG: sel1 repeat family protein [Proteobacteria bacterium]|nr:sel1 repeat family protein [Pseudomonadota bacterium]
MRKLFAKATVLSLLMSATAAQAAPLDDAYFALRSGDYDRALTLVMPYAENGVPFAQYVVGSIMDGGFGSPQHMPEEAVKWYKRAAEKGHPEAQTALARCYEQAHGIGQDYTEARRWYAAATEQDIREASYGLAVLHSRGLGGPKDEGTAVTLSRRAAEQGHLGAQVFLANLLSTADDIPHDNVEAVKWFREAAESGHPEGQLGLGVAYRDGSGVEADIVISYVWFQIALKNRQLDAVDPSARGALAADIERIGASFPAQVRSRADDIVTKWVAKRG